MDAKGLAEETQGSSGDNVDSQLDCKFTQDDEIHNDGS